MPLSRPAAIEVVAPNFKRRMSGVTATVIRLVPRQAETGLDIVATGGGLERHVPRLSIRSLLALRRPPAARPVRVWHARRNVEMAAGILLRDLFRFPLALVFTSAAQRRHKRPTRWMIGRMDAVIATSEAAAAYLERPAAVIPHGVDTEHFQPSGSTEKLVGCFGRIRPQKGTDLFVKAIANVVMASSGYAVPTREEALRHDAWLDSRGDLTPAAMLQSLVSAGLGAVWGGYRKQSTEERALARLERQRVEIITNEAVSEGEVAWLAERIGRDGKLTENEAALIAFLKKEGPHLDPALGLLVERLTAAA